MMGNTGLSGWEPGKEQVKDSETARKSEVAGSDPAKP